MEHEKTAGLKRMLPIALVDLDAVAPKESLA